jgi:hypothetical protein
MTKMAAFQVRGALLFRRTKCGGPRALINDEGNHMNESNSVIDPGRVLLHALVYLSKYAFLYPAEAWVDAENILHRAHNQFEDEDRIQFVRLVEEQECCYSAV